MKRQCEKLTSVTNKVKIREKAYLTGKKKVTLNIEGKVLSLIKASERIPKFFLRIIIKKHILKVKHNKTLQHQKTETCLIIMLKTMNKENL